MTIDIARPETKTFINQGLANRANQDEGAAISVGWPGVLVNPWGLP